MYRTSRPNAGRRTPDGNGSGERDVPGLPPRERPGRRTQSCDRPSRRRSLECGVRGGCQQHQGRHGNPASLRPASIRGRPGVALPHSDRHRREPQRRRSGGDRHRGGLDATRGRRHRQDRQTGHRLRHRDARRPRDHHAGVEDRARICSVCVRGRARGSAACGPLGINQMRRIGHDLGLRVQSYRRQRLRQALPARRHNGLRRDHGDHRR